MKAYSFIQYVAGLMLAFAVIPVSADTTNGMRLGSAVPASCRSGGGGSFNPMFSADGRSILFVSQARNLVTNDSLSPHLNVYVRDLTRGQTILASASASGVGGAEDSANYPSVSSNGQFVTYVVRTNAFIPTEPRINVSRTDVFVRDLTAGITRWVSVNTQAMPNLAPGSSGDAVVSADGRWVAFASAARDLVADDTNGCQDVFVRDLLDGTTQLVSVGAMGGIPASGGGGIGFTGASSAPSISANGRFVAFVSTATNLVPGVTNLAGEIYVRDLQAGVTCWASSNVAAQFPTNASGPYSSFHPVISADGRYVAFKSSGANYNLGVGVFRYDLAAGTNALAVSPPDWANPDFTAWSRKNGPVISPDGRFVAYDDSRGVFLWDELLGTNFLVSVRTDGNPASLGSTHSPSITPDGRFVAFVSSDSGMVTPPTPLGRAQIYVRDLVAGTNRLATVNRDGAPSRWDHELIQPVISPDCSMVAFDSGDDALVEGDLNRASDVFVRDLITETTLLVSERHPDRTSATGPALSGLANASCISSNSRWLAFTSHDGSLVPDDANGLADIFIRDLLTGVTSTVGISNSIHHQPVLSADGRYAAYVKSRNSTYALDAAQVYRHDVQTGVSELVSQRFWVPYPAYGPSIQPAISPDGRFVAFQSTAPDLVPSGGTMPLLTNIFVRDMVLGTNYLVSVSTNGVYGNGPSFNPTFSPDGRWVLFQSQALNLVTDHWGRSSMNGGLFARDLISNRTVFVSQLPRNLGPSVRQTDYPAFSADSRWVVFVNDRTAIFVRDMWEGTNAVPIFVSNSPNDYIYGASISAGGRKVAFEQYVFTTGNYPGYRRQIFLLDRVAGTTNLISVNRQGNSGGLGDSTQPLITPDGQFVVFASKAGDLVDGDWRTGGPVAPWEVAQQPSLSDIFVRDLSQGVTLLVSANQLGIAGSNASSKPFLAPDGRTVVFQSFADDLADGDYNATRDIFLLRLNAGDSDGDQMHDDWEMAYFDALSRDGTGDFDGDGHTDRQEFLADTDPTNAGSVLRVITVTRTGSRSATIFWAAAPGRTYRVQFKETVDDPAWTDLSGTVRFNGSTASIVDSPATARQHRFYRVMLQ